MKTRVQRWGNSLAVRIPKAYADEIAVGCDTEVDLSVRDGMLTVAPVRKRKYSLRELVEVITEENRHDEVSTGRSVGAEEW